MRQGLLLVMGAGILSAVWFLAGEYQRHQLQNEIEALVRVRVRKECVRPDFVRTSAQAQEYDLTLDEIDLIAQKMEFLGRRTDALLERANKVEAVRLEAARSILPRAYGVGGPAPKRRDR